MEAKHGPGTEVGDMEGALKPGVSKACDFHGAGGVTTKICQEQGEKSSGSVFRLEIYHDAEMRGAQQYLTTLARRKMTTGTWLKHGRSSHV